MKYIASYSFSDELLLKFTEIISISDVAKIQIINEDNSQPDNILLFQISLMDASQYLVVCVDPFDLWEPAFIERIIPLSPPLSIASGE